MFTLANCCSTRAKGHLFAGEALLGDFDFGQLFWAIWLLFRETKKICVLAKKRKTENKIAERINSRKTRDLELKSCSEQQLINQDCLFGDTITCHRQSCEGFTSSYLFRFTLDLQVPVKYVPQKKQFYLYPQRFCVGQKGL